MENKKLNYGNNYSRTVNDVISYIGDNVKGFISLNELADVACYSKPHFFRIFKAKTGETIHHYLSRSKLEFSAEMLILEFQKSVDEVAHECGFSSPQYYSNSFKRHYQVTPGKFKQALCVGNLLTEYEHRIQKVLEYIDDHLDRNLNLDELARMACFSKFHFHRIFKTLTGEPVQRYIQRKRMEMAARLLIYSPAKSITEIAFECSFSESNNFARAFKNYYHVPPNVFRKTNDGILPEHAAKKIDPQDFEFKEIPAFKVAYTRGPRVPEIAIQRFLELITWAENGKLINETTHFFWMPFNSKETTHASNLLTDTCISINENVDQHDNIGIRKIPGGTYAVIPVNKPFDTTLQAFQPIFTMLGKWLENAISDFDFYWAPLLEMLVKMGFVVDSDRWSYVACSCHDEKVKNYNIYVPVYKITP